MWLSEVRIYEYKLSELLANFLTSIFILILKLSLNGGIIKDTSFWNFMLLLIAFKIIKFILSHLLNVHLTNKHINYSLDRSHIKSDDDVYLKSNWLLHIKNTILSWKSSDITSNVVFGIFMSGVKVYKTGGIFEIFIFSDILIICSIGIISKFIISWIIYKIFDKYNLDRTVNELLIYLKKKIKN